MQRRSIGLFDKMVRTFHPVGQGAYYTEQFLRGGRPVFTMAYDCGSTSLTSKELARVVRNSLAKGTKVDAVFISHFDSDHVNGLPDLLLAFPVKQLFLPFLSDSFEMAYWRLKSLADCGNDFSKAIAYHLLSTSVGGQPLWSEMGVVDPPRVIWVPPHEQPEGMKDDPMILGQEKTLRLALSSMRLSVGQRAWVFEPFNFKRDARVSGFKTALEDALKKCGIKTPVNQFVANAATEMKTRGKGKTLRLLESVDRALKDKKERDKVFSRRYGSINGNSMTLYSGPKASQTCPSASKHMVGCLYLGDFEGNRKRAWGALQAYYRQQGCWNLIGCVQLPHHGSKANYNSDIEKLPACYAVSYGLGNPYGHPDWPTVRRLYSSGHDILIANEIFFSRMVVR